MSTADNMVAPNEVATARRRSKLRDYFSRWPAIIGTCMLGVAALIALGASSLSPADPFAMSAQPLLPPGPGHWMGTDRLAVIS